MSHRGPDDEGYLNAGPVAVGMRRLSIIDLEGGHQPIFNEDGSVGVVLNGEIYNFQELRKQLTDRGHSFRSRSDSEVVAHAYEEWGPECVDHLRGMFAFAVYDRRTSQEGSDGELTGSCFLRATVWASSRFTITRTNSVCFLRQKCGRCWHRVRFQESFRLRHSRATCCSVR